MAQALTPWKWPTLDEKLIVTQADLVRFLNKNLRSLSDALPSYAPNQDIWTLEDFGNSVGQGNDDTSAIQLAVKERMKAGGGALFGRSALYQFKPPIDFTGTTNTIEFYGKSPLGTVFKQISLLGAKGALFSVNNAPGLRAYVNFHDFQILGMNDPNAMGIYCAWTSGYSALRRLLVLQCYDGFRLANDSATKPEYCVAVNNLNAGFTWGLDLADGSAPCNNSGALACIANGNGLGYQAVGCRGFGMLLCDAEGNLVNVLWDGIYGGFMGAQYLEFAPATAGSPTAQWWIKNCKDVIGKGITVSSFKNAGNAIVRVENTSGAEISIAEEFTTGSPSNAVGVDVINSNGVEVTASSLLNMQIALRLDANSRAKVKSTEFGSNTQPVVTAASANCLLDWEDATKAQVDASSFGAGSIVKLGYRVRTGSPEGVLIAQPGNTYLRTDGGAGTTLYVKETGVGNTGWVAK